VLDPRSRGVLDHCILDHLDTRVTTASARRLRGHFQTQIRLLAARFARGLHERLSLEKRGSRECRVRAAPAVSCAKCTRKCAHEHTGSAEASGIPCAMVLRLMPRSPRRRIRLVTVAAGLMAIPIRSDRGRHRQLGTSNGCRDHTVLPYAESAVRPARRLIAHEGLAPRHRSRRRCRVHRIPSRVRDDRDTPLLPGKDGASW
jgi:hypothetical protein